VNRAVGARHLLVVERALLQSPVGVRAKLGARGALAALGAVNTVTGRTSSGGPGLDDGLGAASIDAKDHGVRRAEPGRALRGAVFDQSLEGDSHRPQRAAGATDEDRRRGP
jgi:hypothetical protein